MTAVALLQQQAKLIRALSTVDPFKYWTAETIAAVSGASLSAVLKTWPLVVERLEFFGINDKRTQAAAIPTIAIETASTFLPVREAFWLDDAHGYEWAEAWRQRNLRYWPYYGRGLIQLTWESNYRDEGQAIGLDLVGNPDLAMRTDVAADAFARFFLTHGVADAARAGDWHEVRRRVQGGSAGLDRLTSIAETLMAA